MKRFSDTEWHDLTLSDIDIETEVPDHINIYSEEEYNLLTFDGVRLYYITKLLPEEERYARIEPMILNEDDFTRAKSYFRRTKTVKSSKMVEALKDLKTFPERQIYLRVLSSTKKPGDRHVFVNEVLDLIPILLEKQKTVAKKLTIRLEKYRRRWENKSITVKNFRTINLLELKAILDDFDIDKTLITLIPDISFASQVLYRNIVARYYGFSIVDPEGGESMHTSQAVFMIFQAVGMEIDWAVKSNCTKDHRCGTHLFKQYVIQRLKFYAGLGEKTYVKKYDVDGEIRRLRSFCEYELREKFPYTPGLGWLFCDYNDKITVECLLKKFEEFSFTQYTNTTAIPMEKLDKYLIPIWRARVIFMILWADRLFDSESEAGLKKIVRDAISFKIPSLHWNDDTDLLQKLISEEPEVLEREGWVAARNSTDVFQHTLEMKDSKNMITIFKHPWFTDPVIEKWFSSVRVQLCTKWRLRNSQVYIRDGRTTRKSDSKIDKLIKDFKEVLEDEFKSSETVEVRMRDVGNMLIKMIMVNREMPKQRLQFETAKENQLAVKESSRPKPVWIPTHNDKVIIARHHQLMANRMTIMNKIRAMPKRGASHWRSLRQLRRIVDHSVIFSETEDAYRAMLERRKNETYS